MNLSLIILCIVVTQVVTFPSRVMILGLRVFIPFLILFQVMSLTTLPLWNCHFLKEVCLGYFRGK